MPALTLRVLIVEDTPDRQETLKNLYRDHAWMLVNTARRAIRLLEVYDFDLVSLDYDLAGQDRGDKVAAFIKTSRNSNSKVIVHSMNINGVREIQKHLPDSLAIPISKITRDNRTFTRFRASINKGLEVDWAYVFRKA